MGSPIGDRSDITTANTVTRRMSISKTEGMKKKQKSRLTLPNVTPQESVTASGL